MDPQRQALVVAAARGWIGTPYHHQASLKGVGADCLGLVRGVWREIFGRDAEAPPPYAPDWAETDQGEAMLQAARRHLIEIAAEDHAAGDVVIFRMKRGAAAKHAAILTGPATMIHAMEGVAVAEVALSAWWRRRIAAVFRFPGA
jgi:NlpC/P60 family putative phage cell wall peptidase